MIDIIKRPIFTVKTTYLIEKFNRYVFEIDVKITKPQIRFLIEKIFFVNVCSVNTYRRAYKKRFSRAQNSSYKAKIALVSVANNENIIFFLLIEIILKS